MLSTAIFRKALTVAALVGTVLLLINQFDALFGDAQLRVIPALLTYCVPFVVFVAGHRSRSKDREL
jgi:hypothetical protein